MRVRLRGHSALLIAGVIIVASAAVEVLPAGALQNQNPLQVTSTSGTFGTPLTLTTSGGSGTGAVTYSVTNGTASGCTVSGSTLTSSSAGTCTVTATKARDSTYKAISSSPITVTLAAASSTTTLSTSPASPQNAGTPITLTASVVAIAGPNATGTMNFELGGTSLSGCSAQVLSGGSASCVVSSVAAGSSSFFAVYSGDSNYLTSTSYTLTFVGLVAQATLAVSSTSGTFGTALTLTTSGGSGSGAVSFSTINGTATGCSVSGSTLTSTSAGTCTVTATKASDGTYAAASSSPATVTLGSAASMTTLSASPASPQNAGTSVTLTASVTATAGTNATGTMNFELGGTSISGCAAKAMTNGSATCVVSAVASGTSAFSVVYSGDTNYLTSTSSTLSFLGLAPQATLSVSSTSGTFGTALTLTTSGGSGTGAVTYTITNGTATGCSVSGSTLTSASAGTCTVTAAKASDGTYAQASSSPTTVVLARASSSVLLAGSPASPQSPGTSVTLTATVTALNGTNATGTINFELGGTSISGCSAQNLTGGAATCVVSSIAAGTSTFAAIYSGDANYLTMTSTLLTYLGLSPPTAPSGVAVTLANGSATVSWNASSPTGGFAVLGYTVAAGPGGETCTVAAPSTACTVPGLAAGIGETFSVTATSAGGTSAPGTSSSSTPTLASSTTSLSAVSLSPQNVGTAVTFVATVTPGATGSVNFEDGGVTINGCGPQMLTSGVATCTTSTLAAGSNSLTAVYSGDGNYSESTSSVVSFTISSTTLTTPASPIAITSTSGPYNMLLTLTTSGGSGTGAVTYSVVNGTNSGCSVSGATLSYSSSGTCLVTATKVSDGTYLAENSTVTTVTLFPSYAAVWAVVSTSYYCNAGDSLSGSTCYHTSSYAATPTTTYSCPSGGSLNGTTCTESGYYPADNTPAGWSCTYAYGTTDFCTYSYAATVTTTYSCPSGGSLSGTTCYVTTTYAAYVSYTYNYTCPYGGSLSSSTCLLSSGSSVAPDPPNSVIATNKSGTITVIWIAPAITGSTALTSYKVTATDATTPSNGNQTCTATTPSCTFTGLTLGDAYTFAVVATNYQGLSSVSSSSSNSVTPSTPPGAPTSVNATVLSPTSVTVSWSAPTVTGGSPITSYTVTSSPGAVTCTTSGATSCTLYGLSTGTSYTFSVTATNALGVSVSSSPSNVVVPQ